MELFILLYHIFITDIFGYYISYDTLICSIFFSIAEALFYKVQDGKLWTSYEQFICNLLFLPIFLHGYDALISTYFFRIALFPINVWIYEFIVGTLLKLIYGHNPAWNYENQPGSHFNGLICIRRDYIFRWIILGSIYESYIYIQQSMNIER
jgi:hypothetical protein